MARSSEPASTTRYELRNARRESLLPQNRTAPEEEGMNALPDIEEEDTNALPFNHEITKISTSTKLNTWISAYRVGDIVTFIKYIC